MSNKGVDQTDWHYVADDTVHVLPNGERIRIAREALENMAEQINKNRFFPLTVEHLDFEPPVGRLIDAELFTDAAGVTFLRAKHQLIRPEIVDTEWPAVTASDAAEEPMLDDRISVSLQLEKRNFPSDVLEELKSESPVEVSEFSAYSQLPPLEYLFVFTVGLGGLCLREYLKGFFGAVGKLSAQNLASFIRRFGAKALSPERTRVVTFRFEGLPQEVIVTGHILDAGANDLTRQLQDVPELGQLAETVVQELPPGLIQAAFIHDGECWQLAWYVTDGPAVFRTEWFSKNEPPYEDVLGHPLGQG